VLNLAQATQTTVSKRCNLNARKMLWCYQLQFGDRIALDFQRLLRISLVQQLCHSNDFGSLQLCGPFAIRVLALLSVFQLVTKKVYYFWFNIQVTWVQGDQRCIGNSRMYRDFFSNLRDQHWARLVRKSGRVNSLLQLCMMCSCADACVEAVVFSEALFTMLLKANKLFSLVRAALYRVTSVRCLITR
jgi:hypothetical protein